MLGYPIDLIGRGPLSALAHPPPHHNSVLSSNMTTSPLITADLFPAQITNPDHPKARAIITTTTLYIFQDSPQGPIPLLTAPILEVHGDPRNGFDVYLTTRNTPTPVSIRPATGCGCGSHLPNFRPFTEMRHTAAPQYPPLGSPAPAPAPAPA